jgi:probable DNA metabolism protein
VISVALEKPHDLDVFRDVARRLALADVPPEEVTWDAEGGSGLFEEPIPPPRNGVELRVPADYMKLAEAVICHRDPERHALLYQLLWRLTHGEKTLLAVPSDPLVHRLERMRKGIGREVHKMHAFVRFRMTQLAEGERYVAWFEPEHAVLKLAAPFFIDRFHQMQWSILTPDLSLHWDGETLTETPGVRREDAPSEDALEDWWRTYYRATFNPARVNPTQMRTEMPKRYWRNLPEASLIPELIAEAENRTGTMVATAPTTPKKRIRTAEPAAVPEAEEIGSLQQVAHAADGCTRCPLYINATQTVFGEGAEGARLMLVGEQPGDQEDLQGRPFVGPAGQMLDRALEEAGIDRSSVYVTNAVKHFKFEPRGKRRIHKKPDRPEIEACRFWLDRELALVKPTLVVALGATAGQALYGRAVKVLSERGAIGEDPRGFRLMLTVHPSMILRVPDAAAKQKAYQDFVRDLRKAA